MLITTYQEDRYPLPVVRGKIRVGENVAVRDCDRHFRGEVVWIHPELRYFVAESPTGVRESFLLRVPSKGDKEGVDLGADMWMEDGKLQRGSHQQRGVRGQKYELFGEQVTVSQVADRFGIRDDRIRQRLRRGWDMEKIVLRIQYLQEREEKTASWQMDFSARWDAMRREIFGIV